MNLIVLSLTYIFCKCPVRLRQLRMGLAALGGAAASAWLLLAAGYGQAAAGTAFAVVPFMVVAAFGWHGKRDFVIRVGISWLSAVIVNGVAEALENLTGIRRLLILAAVLVLFFSKALVGLLIFSVRRQKNLYRVLLEHNGKKAECFGLYDTGNCLTVPESGEPVHIAADGLIKQLGLMEQGDIRMIPFQALGMPDGWIMIARIEKIRIWSGHKKTVLTDAWIGRAEDGLLRGKAYQMILNEQVERELS